MIYVRGDVAEIRVGGNACVVLAVRFPFFEARAVKDGGIVGRAFVINVGREREVFKAMDKGALDQSAFV